ncbi:AAA family ATPase [soil metagenome]
MPEVEPQDLDVATWLASGDAFAGRDPVRRVDTHAASIFLTGARAWKLKRPVNLGYLDFSTADKRKAALEAELRLNVRTAPGLYRSLHPISRDAHGHLQIDGTGDPIDWLLEMVRFPDDALLERVAGRGELNDGLLLMLADSIVTFHAGASVCADGEGASRLRKIVVGNAIGMARFPDVLDAGRAQALSQRLFARIDAQAALLDARARSGRVRHCHGDLHLANIALLDGIPTPFDCLEFDAALATTDVLYDLAFLLMDLWERGLRNAANSVFNRYLDLSGEDEAGVGLIAMFMAIRATIRAHVLAAATAGQGDTKETAAHARHYLALAETLVAPYEARLVAIGGLSGSGKSTLARAIGGAIGGAPGARILRSDVLRKRRAGIRPETRLPPSAYTEQASVAVYKEIEQLAATMLEADMGVIADAMFARPDEREAIARIAGDEGARFDGLWLKVPDGVRIQRVVDRPPEASDADAEVARAQSLQHGSDPTDWVILDASASLDVLRSTALQMLGA